MVKTSFKRTTTRKGDIQVETTTVFVDGKAVGTTTKAIKVTKTKEGVRTVTPKSRAKGKAITKEQAKEFKKTGEITQERETIQKDRGIKKTRRGIESSRQEKPKETTRDRLERVRTGFRTLFTGGKFQAGSFFEGRDPKFKRRTESVAEGLTLSNVALGTFALTTPTAPIKAGSFVLVSELSGKAGETIRGESKPGSLRSITGTAVESFGAGFGAQKTKTIPLFLTEFGLTVATQPKKVIQSAKEAPIETGVSLVTFPIGARAGVQTSRLSPRFEKVEFFEGVRKATPKEQAIDIKRGETELFSATEKIDPFLSPLKKEPGFEVKDIRSGLGKERKAFERKTGTKETGLFFSEGEVFTPFVRGKQPGIVKVQAKVSRFPKSIEDRIKRVDTLTTKEKVKLRRDINIHRAKNPDKVFPGQKTSAGLGSEFEFTIAPGGELTQLRTDPLTRVLNIGGKGSRFTIDPQGRIIQLEAFELGKTATPKDTKIIEPLRNVNLATLKDIVKRDKSLEVITGDTPRPTGRRTSIRLRDVPRDTPRDFTRATTTIIRDTPRETEREIDPLVRDLIRPTTRGVQRDTQRETVPITREFTRPIQIGRDLISDVVKEKAIPSFNLFEEEEEKKKKKRTKPRKQQFSFIPNLAGLVFDEPIKQPKGTKIFTGLETRPATIKPLKLSPFQNPSISLKTPKRSLTKKKKVKRKKRKKK